MMQSTVVGNGKWLGVLGAWLVLTVATADASEDKLTNAIDRLAAEVIESHRTAGLGIAIDQGGTVLLDKGYGYADLENKVEATPETMYRIGSVTKQFTGVAIVQLEAAGKLKLDDPVTAILTEYPTPAKPVTVENLLQHTSGIPDFTRDPSHRPNASKAMTHAEMTARFATLPLEFAPGARWNYSNSGYYLLGMIVERVSGETYAEYMASHVLAPIGLDHTRFEAPDGSGRAQGYRPNGPDSNELVVADSISMTQPFAAGALVSTTGDLIKWQRALVEKRTTPPDAFERIRTDLVRSGKVGEQYGYGIRVSKAGGRTVISHGGGIEGFGSFLAYYPESDTTIAILMNTEGVNPRELHQGIEAAVFGAASDNGL